jgi:iron(III) transport system ATP-binding protein
MSAVEVDAVSVSYGRTAAVVDVSLHAAASTMTCVLGPSGCGKTTLLRAIAGFEPVLTGSIRIGGHVVEDGSTRLAPERRNVGYVPQEGALFPHLSVADNVGFALSRTTRAARAARRERVRELLALVGLDDLATRMPHQLSGGQQQRVSVARALANRPEVVLLDEPFAALDASLRERLRHEIRDVLRAADVTALLVTHDRAEALSLGDQVVVMRDGRIVQADSPRRLYAQPADAGVAAMVGDMTAIAAWPVDGCAGAADRRDELTRSTALGLVTLVQPAAPECTVVVRADQIVIVPTGMRAATGSTASGTVRRVEYYGHEARVDVELRPAQGADAAQVVVARIAGLDAPDEGAEVALCVTSAVWPLPASPA